MKSRPARFALVFVAVAVAVMGLLVAVYQSGFGATPGAPVAIASASSSPSETPTPMPGPTATPTSTPTPSPSPSPTPSPIATPKPTPTIPRFPIAGAYTFPIRGCVVAYSRHHHDYEATDIYVNKGCTFVAATSGVVDEVSLTDAYNNNTRRIRNGATRGGLFVSIVGDDGVRYYGAHLSAVASTIRPGVRVKVGQMLGKTGDSGDIKGGTPHLHFGISWPTDPGSWWVRRGELYPWPYLNDWWAGNGKRPAPEVTAQHAKVGDGGCTVDC